jgi:hypothetical protein
MTDNTPTSNQRILLDVIGNIPSAWELDITYPTLPEVTHRFNELPELVLSTVSGDQTHEIAVQASITDDQVFHGYLVTTTHPETAVLTAGCRERRLTSLSQQELLSERIGITHHPDIHPMSHAAAEQTLSLSAAASLAGYFAATMELETFTVEDHSPPVPAGDD